MKALLIWNNLRADRCLDFIHPLPGTSDIVYLSCVLKTVSSQCGPSLFLYPSSHLCLWLFPFCLSCSFLDSPPSFCCLCVFFSLPCMCWWLFDQFFVSTVFITSHSLFPFFFLLPSHFISIFLPRLLSSLSPYSEGIQWIIQKRCRMIMGN